MSEGDFLIFYPGEREESGYAEAHHIHTLGDEPAGPDVKENILTLCPNHHADFDFGMLEVDPSSFEISHRYDDEVDGSRLRTTSEHTIGSEYLRYHNQNQ